MVCPKCGGNRFFAHQVCHMDIIVDENNNFEDNIEGNGIYYAGTPFGPYSCTNCGFEVDNLE